jgi:exopolysaccharide production protein ExoQ
MSFVIHAILLLLCLLVLYLSRSSTSIVIFLLGALLSSLIKLTHKRVGIAIIIWTAIVLLLAPTVLIVTDQLAVIAPLLGRDSQLTGRLDLWLILPSYIAERPWLGYGLGGFWVADSTNVALIWDAVGWTPPHAHDGWLDLLLELGIVGLALLSVQLLLIVVNGIRAVVDGLGPGVQYIVMTTLIMLVFNISESSLVRPGLWWILIIIGATGLARITKEREPAAKRYARRYRSSMGRPRASGAMSEGGQ